MQKPKYNLSSATLFSLLILISIGSSFSLSQDLSITVTIDYSVIGLSQEFTLSVEYSGSGYNAAPEPELPDLSPYAQFVGSSGTYSNVSWINGKMSASKTYSYRFLTLKEGEFEIPPIKVTHKGKEVASEPITMRVVSTPQTTPQPSPRTSAPATPEQSIEGNLFAEAEVNKQRVYQNEPVIVTYRILTRVEVTSFQISKLPNTVGFWAEDFLMPQRPVQRREVRDGREFVVADVKKMALFPTSAGTQTIDPLGMECDVRQPRQPRSRDIFDSLFDDPLFGQMVSKSIYTKPITIEVLPLPETGKPSNFSGAVGNYSISATVDKSELETNEAVTLTLKISGTGNIKMVSKLDVVIPPDLEQYQPKITETINRDGNAITGTKIFEYVLVPRLPGEHRIKPVTFSYFDLASKSYKTISTPEITLNVKKGSRDLISLGPGISKEEVELVGKDIQFIKTENLRLFAKGVYPYSNPLYWILFGLPIACFVCALVYRRHLDELAENTAYARERKANKQAMRHLHKAKKTLAEETQKEFFAEVSRALIGYAADKLNIAAAGLITDDVEKQLLARNVPEEKVKKFVACLKTCDYQRFAPAVSTLDEMKKFFEEARASIVELEL